MAKQAGYQCVMTANGTIGCASNVSLDVEVTEVDTTTRDDGGDYSSIGAIRKLSGTVEGFITVDQAGFDVMEASRDGRSKVAATFLRPSGHGYSCNIRFYKMSEGQPINGAVTFTFTFSSDGTISVINPS